MKYVIYKEVKTGTGHSYIHYVKAFSEGTPNLILSTMSIDEAKIYTSRKAAREVIKKLGDSWNIEKP